ncbi:MAG: hypothetical protein ACREQ1_15495 [Woeseiaceae bacterium]
MRTGSTNSDMMMLVVPLAVSFGLVIVMSGGVDPFITLVDTTIREVAAAAVAWLRAL